MKSVLASTLLFLAWALGAFALRTCNLRDVFVEGRIYFIDADCYSRMERARTVVEHPGTVIRKQDFENYPVGTESHATAPMDYLIAGLGGVVSVIIHLADPRRTSVLDGQGLDVAGALISPLLGGVACGFLALWAGAMRRRRSETMMCAWAAPFLFAVSPILVHGTALGRPDHQSLLIALVLVAIAAEWRLWENGDTAEDRRWGLVAGGSWALALWVSLYEPGILLAASLAIGASCCRHRFWGKTRRPGWWLFAGILSVALLIEHWRPIFPSREMREAFPNWSRSIGELAHTHPSALLGWLGLLVLPAPVILLWKGRGERRLLGICALLLFVAGLTVWQARWGYFLAAPFAMAVPWVLAPLRKVWIAAPLFLLCAWPIAWEWDRGLERAEQNRPLRQAEQVQLRQVALQMRGTTVQPFIAPWWLSPPLAYWSGQPGVAGSSHESLVGIVSTAHFYLSLDEGVTAATLRRIAGDVRPPVWAVFDNRFDREVSTSASLLGVAEPEETLAKRAIEHPSGVEPILTEAYSTQLYRLFIVDETKINQNEY